MAAAGSLFDPPHQDAHIAAVSTGRGRTNKQRAAQTSFGEMRTLWRRAPSVGTAAPDHLFDPAQAPDVSER